eukprot:m.214821 g.214821  ORF g.214821 m.214821 type:complete len:438 (-) comp27386_c0_seq1:116-1429(-)
MRRHHPTPPHMTTFRCTDYYPYMEPWNQFPFANRLNVATRDRGVQSMNNYLDNLLILHAAGQRHNLTFWNYFGAAAFQGHTAVTEVQLQWQMMTSITAGARGLLYWVIGSADTGWATQPRRGRHWEHARRVNSMVLALGPTLMHLRSDAVVKVPATSTPGAALAGIQSLSDVVTNVQETVGCSVLTPQDVTNQGGSSVADNPVCVGGYTYVRCPGIRRAKTLPLQPSTMGVMAGGGWCLADNITESECGLLCNALGHPREGASTTCGSYDYVASTGQCCVNPLGPPAPFLMPVPSSQHDTTVHAVKVATGSSWTCPTLSPSTCTLNTTSPTCAGYDGDASHVVVGHDFLVSTSTHSDGRRALMLMNWDPYLSATPTVSLVGATVNTTAEPSKLPLYEVDPQTGREVRAVDDVPALPGLQLALDVAQVRLFLIGARPT